MQTLRTNLLDEIDIKRPLLVAFSGGSDSMALCCLLLDLREKHPFNLHLIHVDHKVRESSSQEASKLQEFANKNKIPFHLCTLKSEEIGEGDFENSLRIKRYEAIKTYYDQIEAQALVTAHHKGDLIETTLKRVFEGSYIGRLQGIKKKTNLFGMNVLRPLLELTKRDLKQYLIDKNQFWIEDSSNYDTKLQRVKMRHEIIPYLNSQFNKRVDENIVALSQFSEKFDDYLKVQTKPFLEKLIKGPFGVCFDGSGQELHAIECEYIIRKILQEINKELSRDQISKVIDHFQKRSQAKSFIKNGLTLVVDAKRLFFICNMPKTFDSEDQKITIEQSPVMNRKFSWIDLWQGVAFYKSAEVQPKLKPIQKSLKKNQGYFSRKNIPEFLREVFPEVNGKLPLDFEIDGCNHLLLKASLEEK